MSRSLAALLALLLPAAAGAEEPFSAPASPPAIEPAHRAEGGPASGTVTLPLAELLEWRRAGEAAGGAAAPAPPLRATVNRLEITGRLLDEGVDATAQVEVTVLGDGWVAVPLLEVGRGIQLTGLPAIEGGVAAVIDGRLCLVAEKAGAYALSLRWLQRAEGAGRARRIELRPAPGSPAVLRLQYDESLFRLGADVQRDGAGAAAYPIGGRIAVSWARRADAPPRAMEATRPPVEPVVTEAHASIVATLDGRRIARTLYRLRFEGERTFSIEVPAGQAVERVFLNGAARPFARAGGAITLPVRAARAGDQTATVEVVTSEASAGYPLSGTLAFTLPKVDWGVNDLYVTLHLPSVFEYRWAGGSLANVEEAPPVEFAWEIPAPGRVVALRQQLVSGFATVQVAYTVDLASSYYR